MRNTDDQDGFATDATTEVSDDLDLLLAGSAPGVSRPTAERSEALVHLVTATRLQALRGPGRPRRVPRAAAFVGAGALVLAGAGAAAAVVHSHWQVPWADDAVAQLRFTVPSGAQCEAIIGGFSGPHDTVAAAERYVHSTDLASVVDLDAAYAQVRLASIDGSELPPTDENNDTRYRIAVSEAVYGAIAKEMGRQGLSVDGFQIQGDDHCAGDEQ